MELQIKVKSPLLSRDEAIRIFESYNDEGVRIILQWLRLLPIYAKFRITKDPLTGKTEIKRVDRNHKASNRDANDVGDSTELDNAIKHAQEVAATCENKFCANEHMQLAEWLKELKTRRSKEKR